MDVNPQCVFVYSDTPPDVCHKLILADKLSGSAGKLFDNFKGARADWNRPVAGP